MSKGNDLDEDFQEEAGRKTLLERLSEAVEINLTNEQFGVDSLAQTLGMSRSSLHRKLQKVAGVSTSQFVREYRLKRALEILRTEDITASEAAYRVGFSSATYFSTSFHKLYGYPPGEVKSRDNDSIDALVVSEKAELKKEIKLKRSLWLILSCIILLLTSLYLYNSQVDLKVDKQIAENTLQEKSVAVLPFKNWTGDPNLEYVSDGMTDAVVTRLGRIQSIEKVAPFRSTLAYKESNLKAKEIASELGVANLIQGNIQISGNEIKVNIHLIDGKSNENIWTEEYLRDWKSDEIFILQSEVVEGIAASINAAIAKDEIIDIQKIPTKSKLAYSYYLQAEYQLQKSNAAAYANAIPLYESAIELDPDFVDAYLGLATIWYFGGMSWAFYDSAEAWDKAKDLFEKALEIEPSNNYVQELLEYGYFYYEWDLERTENYYQRALKDSLIDFLPSMSADYSIKTGKYENAIKAMDRVIMTQPSLGISYSMKASALMALGQTEEAITLLNNTNSLYGDHLFYLSQSALIYFYLEKFELSRIQLSRVRSQFEDYPPMLIWLNAALAHESGEPEKVDLHLLELEVRYNEGSSGSPAWYMALFNCLENDYLGALDWLEKSYLRRELALTGLREHPFLAPLRNDPRYLKLYEKVGFSKIGLPVKASTIK